jgi:aminopeptidase YwaD
MDQQQNEFTLGGTGTAVGLEDILKKQAEVSQVKVNMSAEGLGPSDHASFYASDKSVLFFFTSPHQDYHTPDDDPQYLNYLGIQEIAEFAYNVILEIANRPVNLAFQEAGPKSRPSSRYGLRATLGLQPDHTAGDVVGMRVEAVTKGKPADLAGMKKGDVIVAIEGKEVNNIYDYMYRLKEFRPGDRISVEIKRNEKKQILIVQL